MVIFTEHPPMPITISFIPLFHLILLFSSTTSPDGQSWTKQGELLFDTFADRLELKAKLCFCFISPGRARKDPLAIRIVLFKTVILIHGIV